ncbi:RNA polymerase II C-terminal domain phosphatase-like 3 [Sesamum alatum]|uniref:protein-serine/threonine phosphatase n=1 Tax=Sesamum alatum TaxID=300844 RepID=A0AAE1Y5Z7_9LAMI|nr:RNA polymerase II C-terminal domain phosphatase-like 3 [Sesamum alatum]
MEDDSKEQQLVKVEVHDVEEGEISDSASVEEITEEAFNTKHAPLPSPTPPPPLRSTVNPNNINAIKNNTGGGSGARVWTMRDLYKYQIASKTSYSGLYNLAWAQAVNNKPLGEVFVMMEDGSNDSGNGNNDTSIGKSSNGNESKVVIDVEDEREKEEGELEEGEIDLDSEFVVENKDLHVEIKNEEGGGVNESSKCVHSIKEQLQNLNVADAQKSYDGFCRSLETTAETLQKMVLEGSFAEKDTLVQLLLTAIGTLFSVFSSMTLKLKEQNKAAFSRLLSQVTSLEPPLFSSLQLKEIEAIGSSLESSADFLSNDNNNGRKQVGEGFSTPDLLLLENVNNSSTCLKKSGIDSGSTGSLDQTERSFPWQNSKSRLVNSRHKGLALPLLDLHKDHDADSLPSPTRDLSAPLPFEKGFILGHGLLKPEWPIPKRTLDRENAVMHPYETDAVKAVSSYQQKFGRSSFFMNDKLPSPTPSEEGDATGDSEISGEVSSSINNVNLALNTSTSGQPVVSSSTAKDVLAGPEISITRNVGPVSSVGSPVLKSSSAKSRDPRLRLANPDTGARILNQNMSSAGGDEFKMESLGTMSSRKQKTVEELVLDGPALKRQRNEISIPNATLPLVSATSIFPVTNPTTTLPVSSPITSPLTSQSEKLPVKNVNATSSLHSLLRDIAGNPSIWMNILKMEHQKSSDDIKNMVQMPNSNSILGAVPSTVRVPPFSSMLGQTSPGKIQTPSQTVSLEESGKVRMKPRDPRRILHNNALQKTAGSDQSKSNASLGSAVMGNLSILKQEDQLEKSVSSSSVKPPDITMQFTSNLRNIADILFVSQPSMPSPVLPQIPSSQPAQVHQAGTETKGVVADSVNLRNGSDSTSEAAITVPPRPLNANAWSDVEHLFEGFDDKQKAAIQRERARRLEEQKKMFAVRKLCLVLDLDHTLLNSAKFVEVDPLHDEMLRKKEEQDREKPQRHLFRFPHMGMWTKLRPGIWNFLEKASKLYELHLYTMGNKYYATEMAKLLDPKGELFSGRVISRGDDGEPFDGDDRVPKSKDLEGVLGMESAVVIVDDSVRVWPHNKLNLIVVERYIYFPCSRRQFGLPGPSLLEIDHDERPEDGTLASSLAVIQRIHENFFAHQSLDEADVRNILASEQRKILAGCRIVFSRVFPVGEANPHMHPLWQTAEQFGAVCINQIDEQVTHVVANSLGTDKVNWALSRGRFVVHPGWVEASALLYRRANEHDFAIKQQ